MVLSRHFAVLAPPVILAALLSCSDTNCSCVAPLSQPMPESEKIYDAVQARVGPSAFSFVEGNLTGILSRLLPGGLVLNIPKIDASQSFGWCPLCITINLLICDQPAAGQCALNAGIVDGSPKLTRVAPDTLSLDLRANLSGTVKLTGSFNCEIPIDIRDKPVKATVPLVIDGRDHVMSFRVANVDVALASSDYDIGCDWGFLSDIGLGFVIDDIVKWIAGLLTPTINGLLQTQLNAQLSSILAPITCLPCDYYNSGCPAGSSCDAKGYCSDAQSCRTRPLGIVGELDVGELLSSLVPGMKALLDVYAAAGQWESAAVDPLVVDNGVLARLVGGVDAEPSNCVPTPPAAEIPSTSPPPRLPFTDIIPGTTDPYMVGIGVSDRFLDWVLYKAYLSGLLCLTIDAATTNGLLSSSTFGLLLPSLSTLTGGQNAPMRLKLRPTHVPSVEIGAGTVTLGPDGKPVLEKPLFNVSLPGLGLDFYTLIDERWMRVVSLTQDISLKIGLDFTPDNKVLLLFDENSIEISNVVASNYEILAEDATKLEGLIPSLISIALPLLTGALAPIQIPEIEGFVLDIGAVQGDLPRTGTDTFEFLGLYASLNLSKAKRAAPRQTFARIASLATPRAVAMSIENPGGPTKPVLFLEVGADRGATAEFSYRVDQGPWSLYEPGPILRVASPAFLLTGPHAIEVRARTRGDYRSADPQPIELQVEFRPPPEPVVPPPHLTGPGQAETSLGTEQGLSEPTAGCATGAGASLLFVGLLALLALVLPRRR